MTLACGTKRRTDKPTKGESTKRESKKKNEPRAIAPQLEPSSSLGEGEVEWVEW
jgi:hypothetical protein